MAINVPAVESYIRAAAAKRGIDPNIAVRVARSEGLAPGVWQSNVMRNGRRETSYGPFQLLVGGGLGDRFIAQTGLDPRDPSTVNAQVDFALDNAAKGGWSPWYGAAKVGVGPWDGLRGSKATGVSSPLSPQAIEFVQNNPQPGGYGDQVERMAFGPKEPAGILSPAPAPNGGILAGDNSLPREVAEYAVSGDQKSPLQRLGAALQELGRTPAPSARPPAFPGGPTEAQAKGLLSILGSPTMGDLLMKRRTQGILS